MPFFTAVLSGQRGVEWQKETRYGKEEDMEEIRRFPYGDLQVVWVKKSRQKTVTLRFTEDGSLRVGSSKKLKLKELLPILDANRSTIEKLRKRHEFYEERRPSLSTEDGALLPFLGKTIRLLRRGEGPLLVFREGENLVLQGRGTEEEEILALRRWYRIEGESYIASRLPLLAERTGVVVKRFRMRKMDRCYGVARKDRGEVTFRDTLLMLREEEVDYILLHELAHLIEANHGPGFYKILDRTCPGHREIWKRLK